MLTGFEKIVEERIRGMGGLYKLRAILNIYHDAKAPC